MRGALSRATINTRTFAILFAIAGNMAISLASFLILPILYLIHGVTPYFQESVRLAEAARISIYFSAIPLITLVIVRYTAIRPIITGPPDKLYDDLSILVQTVAAMLLSFLAVAGVALRLAGLGTGADLSALIQVAFLDGATIYIVLLSDSRKALPSIRMWDKAVLISIVVICISFVKRDALLLAMPLVVTLWPRIKLKQAGALILGASAVIVLNMIVRGNFASDAALTRVLGNQVKYLERYSLNFGAHDQCFGLSTIVSFLDRASYQKFYNVIFDPVVLLNSSSARWDSSNLLERLNYAYCSVNLSFVAYFVLTGLLLLMEKKLNDKRYFSVLYIVVVYAFEGFSFYSIPLVTAVVLLFLSGFWRIGRDAFCNNFVFRRA